MLFRRARRGSYLIIVIFILPVLLGFAALAVDVGYMRLVDMQAQLAADAGAHAAIIEYRESSDIDSAETLGREIVGLNFLAGSAADPSVDAEFTWGGWNYETKTWTDDATNPNAIKVKVRREYPLMFLKVFGYESSVAHADRESVAALRQLDMMVVQDVTGSFAEEIGFARDADLTLLDVLHDQDTPLTRVGMVTFTGDGEVFTDLEDLSSSYASQRAAWETIDWCYKPGSARTQMMDCSAGGDGTNQGAGIDAAVAHMVSKDIYQSAQKWIIISSDGRPQCYPYQGAACETARLENGIRAADDAWNDENVHIVSVFYNESPAAWELDYMQSLCRGSGCDMGNYAPGLFWTDDPSELITFFDELARSIPVALVQ